MRVILCYGLNNNRSVLDDLAEYFNSAKFDLHILELQGHFDGGKNIQEVCVKDWLDDLDKLILHCNQLSIDDGMPVVIICYSLTSILVEEYLRLQNKLTHQYIKGIIHFAPIFSIKRHLILTLKILSTFGVKNIKSFSPVAFRSNNCLPVKLYFGIINLALAKSTYAKDSINRLIFLSYRDEVINFKGVAKFAKDFFTNFKLHPLTIDPLAPYQIHHLILTKKQLGKSQWLEVEQLMDVFLKSV